MKKIIHFSMPLQARQTFDATHPNIIYQLTWHIKYPDTRDCHKLPHPNIVNPNIEHRYIDHMKKFTISITDDKTKLFLDILNELSFIENIEDLNQEAIPEEHKNIVRERIVKYGDNKYNDWNELNIDLE